MSTEVFDLKTIASLLQALAVIGGGALVLWRLALSVGRLEQLLGAQRDEIVELRNETKKLGDILTKIAVQDERLNFLGKKVDELAHWNGFIGLPPWKNWGGPSLPSA